MKYIKLFENWTHSQKVKDLVIGNEYKSYFVNGSPNTDDYEVLRQWSFEGNSLPSGSYATSSFLLGLYEDTTFANDMTEIIFENSASVIIGGEARVLVHNTITNKTTYERVTDLTTDYGVFGQSEGVTKISEINLLIFDEQQPVYMMNMEDVDNFILESGNFVSFFVVIVLTFVHCVPDWKCVILWSGILYWLYVLKFAMTVPLNVPNMPLIRPAAKLVKRLAKNAKKHAKK